MFVVMRWMLVASVAVTAGFTPVPRPNAVLRRRPVTTIPNQPLQPPQRHALRMSAADGADTLFGLPRTSVAQPLGLLLLAQFLLFIGVGAVIPVIPLLGKAIGLSSATNGLVIGSSSLALLVLARPAGRWADEARKPVMIAGMGIIAVSDLGTSFADSLLPLLLARLGLGAGRCISESGERGMLADIASLAPELRGRALAAQQAVSALGIAIGAPAGGLVVEAYGPRAAFLCVSAAACTTAALYFFLPETLAPAAADTPARRTPAALRRKEQTAPEEEKGDADWGLLLADDRWRGLALCESGLRFGYACKIAAVPLLATAVLPGGAAGAGALLSAAGLSGLVGAPAGGWLTDRVGARVTCVGSGAVAAVALALVPVALDPSLAAAAAAAGLAPPWLTYLPDGAPFAALILLWSTAVSAQGIALTACAQSLAPRGAVATSMALPRAIGDGTYVVAPFLLGVVADSAPASSGLECAVAGGFSLLGVAALGFLGGRGEQAARQT